MSMNSQLNIVQYTEKSFVVRGNTTENKEQLKTIGGKYNALLKGGPGWIFPNFLKKNVEEYIRSGSVCSNKKNTEGEDNEKSDDKKYTKNYSSYSSSSSYNNLDLTKRVEVLEEQVKFLMNKLNLQYKETKETTKEKEKKVVKDNKYKQEVEEDEELEEELEEEVEVPRKSFLTKNKK